ncbi:hypothetical protein GOODEAATRI_015728 [Goodea atripinnis]|uniref:Uncharacterized protein n=1 Tax=Goodea atripinnis TaxID=208336 RepID=A0ABV0PNW4_9TELE
MSVCQQRDISAVSLCPDPRGTRRRDRMFGKTGFYLDSDITGSPLLPLFLGCAGNGLMRFILKVPETFVSNFHVVTMAGSQHEPQFFSSSCLIKKVYRRYTHTFKTFFHQTPTNNKK